MGTGRPAHPPLRAGRPPRPVRQFTGERAGVRPRLWEARFAARIPRPLVNAFVTALADPSPLQRGIHDRTAHYSAVQEP
ncbi:DUF317 domain-containing protein [Streptomyces sp. NPDC101234]|uniref:DUF317 domain-containing protein n=1 Tax=Streptomyces sp. NPDC101234 TaxID=3366138 RepID=UPI0038053A51